MTSRLSKESRTLMVVRWMLDHPCCLAIRSQTNESTEKWSDWVAKGDVPPPIVVKPPQFSSRAPHHVDAGTRSDQVAIRPPYLIAATSQDSAPSAGGIPALEERVAALVIEDPARGPKTGPTHASAIPGEGGARAALDTSPREERSPSSLSLRRRKDRAARAARNAAQLQSVDVTAPLGHHFHVSPLSNYRAPKFETPVFSVKCPSSEEMRVDSRKMLALALAYCGEDDENLDNRVSEAEQELDAFIRENRRRRHNRARVNRCRGRALARRNRRRRGAAREFDQELVALAERLTAPAGHVQEPVQQRPRRARRRANAAAAAAAAPKCEPRYPEPVAVAPGSAQNSSMAPGGGHPQETGPAEPAHRQGGKVNPVPSPGVAQNGAGYPAVHSPAEEFRTAAAAQYGEAVDPLQLGAGPSSRCADVNANAPESVRAYLGVPLRPASRSESRMARADSSQAQGELLYEISADEPMQAADQIIDASGMAQQDAERQEAQHSPEEHDEGIAVEIEPIQDDDDFMPEFLQAMNVPQPSLRMKHSIASDRVAVGTMQVGARAALLLLCCAYPFAVCEAVAVFADAGLAGS
ncbi:hypothetical protein QAD02_013436 [Eretmocerus hayati]|uniref:Uncharacterized protein n=1 Tax=Eretmocerus hayati TaxID=131215 RepID=A0ACC2P249_9HYME|nr:hypothetical protein QAD02_013436 [Eretmocerus hayati]